MTALDLLRKLQWRAGSYDCIGCGAMHRDGCKPGCEVSNALAIADGGFCTKAPRIDYPSAATFGAGPIPADCLLPDAEDRFGRYHPSNTGVALGSTGGNHVVKWPGTAAKSRTKTSLARRRTKPTDP